jgi:hypothetical protein
MLDSITLRGTYEEMGEQYGRQAAKKIRSFAGMSRVMASLAHKPGSRPFDPNLWYLPSVLLTRGRDHARWREVASSYEEVLLEYYPDALDFIRGVARGAVIDYLDALFLNVSTENIVTCSIWGATGTATASGEPFIAMNADEEPMAAKYEMLVDYRPTSGYRYKVTGFAGWLGFNHGMNEEGLALASTLLFLRPPVDPQTVRPPMFVLMRALNTCATVDEARAWFESVPNHAVGSVFYVADSEKLMRVECSPEGRVYEVVENGARGNANGVSSQELAHLDLVPELRQSFNADLRTTRMASLLEELDGRLDRDAMHRIAADHGDEADGTAGKSICQHAKLLRYNFQTLVSFVAQPRRRTFWVVDGCPCDGQEVEVNFED